LDELSVFLQQLAPISDKELIESLSFFQELTLGKNDYFIQQGKLCRNIGFVVSGSLKTFYVNEKAEKITSCFCSKNDLTTSYKSFITQTPSTHSIQALELSKLMVIDFDNLQKLYENSVSWQNIGRRIAEKEYFNMEQYASVLNTETAKEKYLRLLDEQPRVLQTASIEDIASYLGITRRTLSRIRQEISK
jgi:CRP-like cAMP-binding protein